MEPIYRQQYLLTDNHLDCFRRLKASSLLYFIQDVAGNHALELGTGWETLARKQLFWALIRHKIQITRLPEAGETITLETWPMPTTRVAYPRATVAYDEAGRELFRSVALWVLMDLQTRAMILPGKSGIAVNGLLRGNELEIPPALMLKSASRQTVRQVGFSLLDRNGHMNNTYYMDWVNDLLPAAFHRDHPLKELTLCYLSEAREGQAIQLHWSSGEELWVDALRQEETSQKQQRVFAAQLKFR